MSSDTAMPTHDASTEVVYSLPPSVALVVIALGFSIGGVLLAVAGAFRWWSFLAGGIVCSLVLLGVTGRRFRTLALPERSTAAAGAVAALAVVLTLASGVAFSSEHLITNRDPGVYINTGRWLAEHGTLIVEGAVGGFEGIEGIDPRSQGLSDMRPDGSFNPQFLHLTAVWLAVGNWIGGDAGMLRTPALLAALALAAFWLFARQFLRPWPAAGALLSLAVSLVVVHFSRDAYSEFAMLGFLFAGLWLLDIARRHDHARLAFLAGLTVGATAIARLDALALVVTFIGYLVAVEWRAIADDERSVLPRFTRPVLRGTLLALLVAFFDLILRSPAYLAGRRHLVLPLLLALAFIVAAGVLAGVRSSLAAFTVAILRRHRRSLSVVASIGVVVFALVALFVRPWFPGSFSAVVDSVEMVQGNQGLAIDGTRNYYELTFHWFAWYLGFAGVAVAVFGWSVALRMAIKGSRVRLAAFLAVFTSLTLVYVVRPFVVPDQLWAMRRFLPVTLTGLVFLAFVATQYSIDRWWSREFWQRTFAGGAAALLLIAIPATFTWPLRDSTAYRGVYAATIEVCDSLPENSAVLVEGKWPTYVMQFPLRSFCGLPVAAIGPDVENSRPVVEEAAAAWAGLGVTMLHMVEDASGGTVVHTMDVDFSLPELTLTRRPSDLDWRNLHFDFVEVGPGA